MFKKIVSNISFSPALVGQLGFYAKRISKEESARKLGLIFTAMALVVQSFIVFQPPQSANAASNNDFIRGGFQNIDQYLSNYDNNNGGLRDFYNGLGITRAEIAKAKKSTISSSDKTLLSWGRLPHFSASQGERAYTVAKENGGTVTMHARPLWRWDTSTSSTYTAFIGYSEKVGWFALMTNCGNLVTKTYPVIHTCDKNSTGLYPNCQPKECPDGQLGTYPDCRTPQCPENTTGTYPNCAPKECKDGEVGTYPDCRKPAVALCQSLDINTAQPVHTLTAKATLNNGAVVKGYTYEISKNGTVIKTLSSESQQSINRLSYEQSEPGNYSVKLIVNTSEGDKTSDSCIKTFTITEPEVCQYNNNILADDKLCQPCEGDGTLWIKDEKCAGNLVKTKTAENVTQKVADATKTTAQAGDRITYKLTLENDGKSTIKGSFKEQLNDVLEYADIHDVGGGVYDKEAKTLTWPEVNIEPNGKETRIFAVKVKEEVAQAAQGTSDRSSYDCTMTNTFGNSTSIKVGCPAEKQVEQVVAQLPKTGPTENMVFAGIVLSIVTYFYVRSRQIKKEVKLIRRNLNAGMF